MTAERFKELSLVILHRHWTQAEAFELMNALLEARPELSA